MVDYQCTVNLGASTSTPPTGSISYSLDNATPVTVAISGGNAPFTVNTLPAAGPHTLTISYAGQGNYAAAATITKTFTTQQGQTELQVTPSSYYLAHGTSLTLSGTATGKVEISPAALLTSLRHVVVITRTFGFVIWPGSRSHNIPVSHRSSSSGKYRISYRATNRNLV